MSYFFTDYNWIERQIRSHEEALSRLGITDIVAITRGGICPALMAAFLLDIPKIHLLNYDRDQERFEWQSHRDITAGSVVLLCEDVVGTGKTFTNALAHVRGKTQHVHSLTVFHFRGSAQAPDFGYYSDDVICILPWERHMFNPAALNDWETHRKLLKPDSEYFVYGSDLDGVFLPDVEESLYQTDLPKALATRATLAPFEANLFPDIPLENALIVSGRPSSAMEPTREWLLRHRIPFADVHLRNERDIDFATTDAPHIKAEKAAVSKVAHIERCGITHFYESDPLQAILIANKLPMVRVCWWNNALMIRKWITADDLVQPSALP